MCRKSLYWHAIKAILNHDMDFTAVAYCVMTDKTEYGSSIKKQFIRLGDEKRGTTYYLILTFR